jgi:hypothetical protein
MIHFTQRREKREGAKSMLAPQALSNSAPLSGRSAVDEERGFAAGATSWRLLSFAPLRANRISELSA